MPIEEHLESASREIEVEIKTALMKKGWTQADLAKRLNISRQQLNQAVKGSNSKRAKEIRETVYELLGMEWSHGGYRKS